MAAYKVRSGADLGGKYDADYFYAQYDDGTIESLYGKTKALQGNTNSEAGNEAAVEVFDTSTLKSESELKAEGVKFSGEDQHGIGTPDAASGYGAYTKGTNSNENALLDAGFIAGMALIGGVAAGGAVGAEGAVATEGGMTAADAAAMGDMAGGTAGSAVDSAAGFGGATAGDAGLAGGGTGSGSSLSLGGLKDIATILTPLTSLLASGLAYDAAGDTPTDTPPVLTPTAMPIFGGPNTILAQRNSVSEQLQRRGRASTIMTSPRSEHLGAG